MTNNNNNNSRQHFTSATTSINSKRAPALFTMKSASQIMQGRQVIDLGGGRYDTAQQAASQYGATVATWDPYNRTPEHNRSVMGRRYDVATISNVLNVIDTEAARAELLQRAAALAPVILITVYEGDRSGKGRQTGADSWQENRPTADYITEIVCALGSEWNVCRRGRLIVCTWQASRAADPAAPAASIPEELQPVRIAPRLHISAGNSKLGRIHNMSLAPGKTCSATACKTCLLQGCYARDSYNLWPSVRAAWDDNTAYALQDLASMERDFTRFFSGMNAPRFFRIHVGGDFVNAAYAMMWFRIAQAAPHTQFLAFTKQFDVVRPVPFYTLPNFSLVLSDWPGAPVPDDLRKLYRVAWLDDGTRPADTFPADCFRCPGHCDTCGYCWHGDRDTLFKKH